MMVLRRIHEKLHLFMAIPALLLFAVFFMTPLVQGIHISLTDWTGTRPTYNYVGLQNFADFFHDDRAKHALKVTLIFGLLSPVLLCLLGLIYALILDVKLVGRGFVRTFVYLPAIISPLIMGYVWLIMLNSNGGAIPAILKSVGLSSLYKDWLGNPHEALWVVIILNLWQFVGYAMIIFLAGLQSVSAEVLEAAKIDGASYIKTLRYVTFPLLIPAIRINVITNIIGSLGVFDVIASLTDGGPGYWTESMSMYIYRASFDGHTGYATAVAVILFIIVLIPVVISLYLLKKADYEN
jgi:raffinose/stachyose/melibiose transport system permease protein